MDEYAFSTLVKSYVAPVYFFDQKKPIDKCQFRNGTVTLFRGKDKLYGITNYHVYEAFQKGKQANSNYVCQHEETQGRT